VVTEPNAWAAPHHNELTRLQRLDRVLSTRTRMAGYAAEIDRPVHIVALIGHPPRDLEGRALWRSAAGAIESYQARWDEQPSAAVDDQTLPLYQATHLEVVRRKVTELQGHGDVELEL
jgi:hypothetical protein